MVCTAQPFPPKHEVRAVWITTAAGLDWPKTQNSFAQQSSLRQMVHNLKSANFNTIFFQARARGDAYYKSSYEPWAENLTGTLGKDPGWDPLAFIIDEAHNLGMEVHAWFNVYKIRGPGRAAQSSPQHPSRSHPEWTVDYESEGWFDPGIPAVNTYLLTVALELARTYDIDGMHFDFIRYPGKNFQDEKTFRRYGSGQKDDWRRANIDRFVATFYDSVTTIKPMLKVGSAPIGVFSAGGENGGWGAYASYYQNSRGWLRSHKQDYLVPQLYWDFGDSPGDPDFAALLKEWVSYSYNRHVYAGIGAYKNEVLAQLAAQIDTSRSLGALGQAFFRYEHIERTDVVAHRYDSPALIPPMPWKDPIPPAVPTALAVTEITPNIFHLEWAPPRRALDGDEARRYSVYRWNSADIPMQDARALIAITNGPSTYYVDTVKINEGVRYYYAVCAVDKGNNESAPCTTAPIVARELAALNTRFASLASLSTITLNNDEPVQLAGYKVGETTDVLLSLFRTGIDKPVAILVDQVQNAGTYIVSLPTGKLVGGSYQLRLKAGSTQLSQPVDIIR